MKQLLIIFTALAFAGCGTPLVKVERHIVKQKEYIIKIPPSELMTFPAPVPHLDVDSADQADVSSWLLDKEQYTRNLENKLRGIADFFVEQQKELDKKAAEENEAALKEGEEADKNALESIRNREVDLNAQPSR